MSESHSYHDYDLKIPALLAFLIFVCTWPAAVFAQPIFAAETDSVRIVLYDEPCAFQDTVKLPFRATWTEKGKVYEGCFAPHPHVGVVVAFFKEDKSVAAIPMEAFRKVTGI
jgi:hypothetical protein